jgi:hypothetical protein
MSDFMAVTACYDPKIKDHQALEQIISRYFLDPDFNLGVGFSEESGEPYLFIYGYCWPEAWKMPAGIAPEDFDPYTSDLYEEGADGFVELLKDLAPYLIETLTVQAIGSTCFFPLSACEWHIQPNGKEVQIHEFRNSNVGFRSVSAA